MRTVKPKTAPRKPLAPNLLLARFTPDPLALSQMPVATLRMPYTNAIRAFTDWLAGYFKRHNVRDDYGDTISPYPPYRLLNTALLALAPTFAHAFEWYGYSPNKYLQMLVVGKPEEPLACPTTAQIASVMRQWIRVWHGGDGGKWLQNAVADEGKSAWETLLTALNADPDTAWRTDYDLRELLTDTRQEGGFAFDLMPNLVATLLHETETVIHGKTVRWRRMQEGGKHLCLVTDPIPVQIPRTTTRRSANGTYAPKTTVFDTFLSYKLEIALHDQAGLATPWVYLKPHCTRYATLPMTFNKRDTEITILTGANEARLNGWVTDTTLVRLKASKIPKQAVWLDNLPKLLKEIGARALPEAKEICANPTAYWSREAGGVPRDQYYIVHTEGYSYKGAATHPVFAGLPLAEQAEIIGTLTNGFLRDVLTPDAAIIPDPFGFDPKNEPVILRNIEQIRKYDGVMTEATYKKAGLDLAGARKACNDKWRPTLLSAIARATRGKRLLVACFYHTPDTLDWVERGLWQSSLLLAGDDPKPDEVTLLPIPLPAHLLDLVKPCAKKSDNKPQSVPDTTAWRTDLLRRWQEFLGEKLAPYAGNDSVLVSAIVELDKSHDPNGKTTILGRESAHSVVREVFARNNVRVQMTAPIPKGVGRNQFDSAQIGKSLNVVQETVTRQLGRSEDVV